MLVELLVATALGAPSLAALDACLAGDGPQCAAIAGEAPEDRARPWLLAACAAGVGEACPEPRNERDLEALVRGCTGGSAAACTRLGQATTVESPALEKACAGGACDPLALLAAPRGPVTRVAAIGPRPLDRASSVHAYRDGAWFVGNDGVATLPWEGPPQALPTAPVHLMEEGARPGTIVPFELSGDIVPLGTWELRAGVLAAAEPLSCDVVGGDWIGAPGCRSWSRGSARVDLAVPPRIVGEVGVGEVMWVFREGGLYFADPDGERLVAQGRFFRAHALDGERVYVDTLVSLDARDRDSGELIWSFPFRAYRVSASPDGRLLAVGNDKMVAILTPATGEVLYRGALGCSPATWTHEGDLLCTGARQVYRLEIGAGSLPDPGPMPALVLPAGWPGPAPVVVEGHIHGVPAGTPVQARHAYTTVGAGGEYRLVLPRPERPRIDLAIGAEPSVSTLELEVPEGASRIEATFSAVDVQIVLEGCTRPVRVSLFGEGEATRSAYSDASGRVLFQGLIAGDVAPVYAQDEISGQEWSAELVLAAGEVSVAADPVPEGPARTGEARLHAFDATGRPYGNYKYFNVWGADPDGKVWSLRGATMDRIEGGHILVTRGDQVEVVAPAVPIEVRRPPVDGPLWLIASGGGAPVRVQDSQILAYAPGAWTWTVFDGEKSAEIQGVARSGLVLDLPAPSEVHAIVGRLVGPDGWPLGEAEVTVKVSEDLKLEATTDLAGRFTLAVPQRDRFYDVRVGGWALRLEAGDSGEIDVASRAMRRSLGVPLRETGLGLYVGAATCLPEGSWLAGGDTVTEACGAALAGVPSDRVVAQVARAGSCAAVALRADGTRIEGILPLSSEPRAALVEARPDGRCGVPLDAQASAVGLASRVLAEGQGAAIDVTRPVRVRFVQWHPNGEIASSELAPSRDGFPERWMPEVAKGRSSGALVRVWVPNAFGSVSVWDIEFAQAP